MMVMKNQTFQVSNGRTSCHLIPYIGNKSGFSHIFDSLIPDSIQGKQIYDAFGGGASFSIYCSYRFGSKYVTYNDNNPTVANFISWVKKDPHGLAEQYETHRDKSDSQYYLDVRDMSLDDGLVGAGRFLYLAKNAFSGKIRFNSSNKFNSPMRKDSKCPNLNLEQLAKISTAIQDLVITNESFEHYEDVKGGFVYLDPPYLENTNNHYNGVPDTEDFIGFVKKIEAYNQVMISEQNSPYMLRLSASFRVYPILLKRSLQYITQNSSKEIVAINYIPPEPLVAHLYGAVPQEK